MVDREHGQARPLCGLSSFLLFLLSSSSGPICFSYDFYFSLSHPLHDRIDIDCSTCGPLSETLTSSFDLPVSTHSFFSSFSFGAALIFAPCALPLFSPFFPPFILRRA